MKTGSWFTTTTAPGRVGISTSSPRKMPAGFRLYRALAPERAWLDLPRAEYEVRFVEKLAALDPQRTCDDLHAMARDPSGANASPEPVLLCYERPPFTEGNWCHRRIVAAWFASTLSLRVSEWGYDGPDLPMTPEGLAAFRRAFGSPSIRAE